MAFLFRRNSKNKDNDKKRRGSWFTSSYHTKELVDVVPPETFVPNKQTQSLSEQNRTSESAPSSQHQSYSSKNDSKSDPDLRLNLSSESTVSPKDKNGIIKQNKKNRKKKKSSLRGSFLSKSTSKSSTAMSARSIVSISNSALSMLDYEIERTDVDSAVCTLKDLAFDIKAVWVVARPIDRAALQSHKFEHWCVKIHAHPALISVDFFEQNGRGAFGVSSVCASWTELEDFLHYFYVSKDDANKMVKRSWKILSMVVPTKYEKNCNLDRYQLPIEIGKNVMNSNSNLKEAKERIDKIKCDYQVRDISEFIEDWVDENKSYNTLGTNCQRFAYDLYQYLIGDYYSSKVRKLDRFFQSPLDRQKSKLNRLKKNQDTNLDNDLKDSESDMDDDDGNNDDDDSKANTKQNSMFLYNNPESNPNILIESMSEIQVNKTGSTDEVVDID